MEHNKWPDTFEFICSFFVTRLRLLNRTYSARNLWSFRTTWPRFSTTDGVFIATRSRWRVEERCVIPPPSMMLCLGEAFSIWILRMVGQVHDAVMAVVWVSTRGRCTSRTYLLGTGMLPYRTALKQMGTLITSNQEEDQAQSIIGPQKKVKTSSLEAF